MQLHAWRHLLAWTLALLFLPISTEGRLFVRSAQISVTSSWSLGHEADEEGSIQIWPSSKDASGRLYRPQKL